MRTMQKTVILLLLALSLLAMNACQLMRNSSGMETGETTEAATTLDNDLCRTVLDRLSHISTDRPIKTAMSPWGIDYGYRTPMFIGMVTWPFGFDPPYIDFPREDESHAFDDSYMLNLSDELCKVGVYRISSESENDDTVYYIHMIFTESAPTYKWLSDETSDDSYHFTGKVIYSSATSATADTSLLKPGASVRSLLDSFPELGLYCEVDGRFPSFLIPRPVMSVGGQTITSDLYAGPAVLMVNEGFFLITTELSEDGTDVLIKEVTKQNTLTYQDLCALFGA